MTVTPESNYALIQQLQDLVSSAAEPPSGPEQSFPIVGQGVNTHMWQQMMRGFGGGVLDLGGYPFRMSGTNDVTGAVTIQPESADADGRPVPAQALIDGFFYRLNQPRTLTIPNVSTATPIAIALQYDPQRENDASGPIRLDIFTGTLNRTQGRKYIVLWDGMRLPSTVPSEIVWTQKRHRVSPTIHVAHRDHLPDPNRDGLLYGTVARVGQGAGMYEMILRGQRPNMSWGLAVGEWADLTLAAGRVYPGHGVRPAWRLTGDRIDFRGRVALQSGAFTASDSGWQLGWPGTLYEQLTGGFFAHAVATGPGAAKPVRVSNSAGTGALYAYPAQSCSWIDLGGVVGWTA